MYALLFLTGNIIQAGHYKLLSYRYITQKGFFDRNEVSLHHQNLKAEIIF